MVTGFSLRSPLYPRLPCDGSYPTFSMASTLANCNLCGPHFQIGAHSGVLGNGPSTWESAWAQLTTGTPFPLPLRHTQREANLTSRALASLPQHHTVPYKPGSVLGTSVWLLPTHQTEPAFHSGTVRQTSAFATETACNPWCLSTLKSGGGQKVAGSWSC